MHRTLIVYLNLLYFCQVVITINQSLQSRFPTSGYESPCSILESSETLKISVSGLKNVKKNKAYGNSRVKTTDDVHIEMYAPKVGKSSFEITCISRRPISQSFLGLLPNRPNSSAIYRYLEKDGKLCYEIRTQIQTLHRDEATGGYICQNVSPNGQYELFKHREQTVYIFSSEGKGNMQIAGRNLEIVKKGLNAFIPCKRTYYDDPNYRIKLFQDGVDLTLDASYDVQTGYIVSPSKFPCNKTYMCIHERAQNLSVFVKCDYDRYIPKFIIRSNETKEIQCSGGRLSYVNCYTKLECGFLKSCGSAMYKDSSNCGLVNETCEIAEGISCGSLTLNESFQGVVYCSNDHRTVSMEIFKDINGIEVSRDNNGAANLINDLNNWIKFEFSSNALEESWIEEIQIYENTIISTNCTVSKLVATKGVEFYFELLNGTEIPAPTDLSTDGVWETESTYQFQSDIKFISLNITGIICRVPLAFSSGLLEKKKTVFILQLPTEQNLTYIIALGVVISIFISTLILILVYFKPKYKQSELDEILDKFDKGNLSNYKSSWLVTWTNHLFGRKHLRNENIANLGFTRPFQKEEFEIKDPKASLITGSLIGSGNLGSIRIGQLKLKDGTFQDVVIKVAKTKSNEQIANILWEIKILMELGNHFNIVKLCGAVTDNIKKHRTPKIVLEYCEYRDLVSFFHNYKIQATDLSLEDGVQITDVSNGKQVRFNSRQLYIWSSEIASAMSYVAGKGFLHRDLSARNVLLSEETNGKLIAKLGDFELAKNLQYIDGLEYAGNPTKKMPYKYLPPESLTAQPIFSAAGDIWSFGVFVWELTNLCQKSPYQAIGVNSIHELQRHLKTHPTDPLLQPQYGNINLYEEVILQCMTESQNDRARITFSDLEDRIFDALSELGEDEIITIKCTIKIAKTLTNNIEDTVV